MFFLQFHGSESKSVILECLRLAILTEGHELNKLTYEPREERLSGRLNNLMLWDETAKKKHTLNKTSILLTLLSTSSLKVHCSWDLRLKFTVSSLLPTLMPPTKWQISPVLYCSWASTRRKYVSFSGYGELSPQESQLCLWQLRLTRNSQGQREVMMSCNSEGVSADAWIF